MRAAVTGKLPTFALQPGYHLHGVRFWRGHGVKSYAYIGAQVKPPASTVRRCAEENGARIIAGRQSGLAVTARKNWNEEDARAIIAREQERGLLAVLSALNETFGYLHRDAIGLAAKALNLSRAEVHGVASFYHDFRERPPGRHVLKLCGAEACQSMGGDALAAHATRELGIGFGETTPDDAVTLERVYCLGLCACAPAAMLDDEPHARLDNQAISSLIAETRE
jgi:formate dehydrogenase subunit gamma